MILCRLTPELILAIWERAESQPALDRALTILAAALPETLDPGALARLSLARRDQLLRQLRIATFGPVLDGVAACEQCGTRLEFSIDLERWPDSTEPGESLFEDSRYSIELDGRPRTFRLPSTLDLESALGPGSVRQARRALAESCLEPAEPAGANAPEALSDSALERLCARMEEIAPGLDPQIALACPECGHAWLAVFDIAACFWLELRAQALRLFHEVHRLAQAYGWREAEILALTPRRRRAYLELIG